MESIKFLLKRMLHHPNTMSWAFISIMVAIMASYNTIIRYGFSEQMLEKVFIIYPLIVIFIYALRTYVTLPLVLKVHNYFPTIITNSIPRHISVPTLVITFNVSIMMVWFTEIHRQLYPQFLPGYLGNWMKTFFVAIPVFFFVVRPTLITIFKKLRQSHPLSLK
ncbi:hypothetical protein KGP39_04230 [Weissella hellenica]|nr:hypothetical protein [Weissella hellenica]